MKYGLRDRLIGLLIRTGLAKHVTFSQGDYRLRLCPGTSHRWLAPIGERPVEEFFRRYVKRGDTVIDAGANVGIFTVVCAIAAGEAGRVYAIEAHPRTFQSLADHVELNELTNVSSFNVALDDKPGQLRFSDDPMNDDLNHVMAEGGISVPGMRLDDLVRWQKRIDLLKIDVEGYEKYALLYADKLLASVQCMLIEIEDDKCRRCGYTARELVALIQARGFSILRVSGNAVSHVPSDFVPKQPEDLVAVRDVAAFLE